jgi:hypothetical protein
MNRFLLTQGGLLTSLGHTARHGAVAFLVLLLPAGFFNLAHAETAGQVTHLSGPLFGVKADGARQVLSVNSAVDPGDTLITETKTYARVKFTDASEVTLRPNTQFKIENYAFVAADPAKDNALFSLFKGALRTITGLVGKRSNQDAYRMVTPTATIGIRGTQYVAEFVPEEATAVYRVPYALPLLASADFSGWGNGFVTDIAGGLFSLLPPEPHTLILAQSEPHEDCDRRQPGHSCDDRPAGAGGRPPGLYVQVIDGQIQLSNLSGSQFFSAGQFGFVGTPGQPPVILPSNPGIHFSPPPLFAGPPAGPGPTPSGQPVGPQAPAGCEVR